MVHIHAHAGPAPAPTQAAVLESIIRSSGGHRAESLLFVGGVSTLVLLVATLLSAPALCPLLFLAFVAIGLPHRVYSFVRKRWVFYLVDFCYFANLACAAFLLLRPEDARLEAAVYALCEGPLAAALLVWQCTWLMASPDHITSVLLHLLPGLALHCHRFLAHTRQPLRLLRDLVAAATTATATAGHVVAPGHAAEPGPGAHQQQPVGAAGGLGGGLLARIAGVGAVARGDAAALAAAGVPVPHGHASYGAAAGAAAACSGLAWPAAAAAAAAGGAQCHAGGAGGGLRALPAPGPCPPPGWLWLGAAPLAFYLAWQLLYFLIVQVACRRVILQQNYDTSYRCLARRAQRANSSLNRLVRSGGVARRLLLYGLLQLLFTIVAQALAAVTYHSLAAATAWQVVKLVTPVYLGARHQCERLPAQQVRAAVARMAAAGLLAPGVLADGASSVGDKRIGTKGEACEAERTEWGKGS